MASATGAWGDDAPPPSVMGTILDYAKGLPGRALAGFGAEGNRLLELGRAGPKEQARDMYGVGRFVDAYDAARDQRYLPAIGNAALGVADLAGPARSRAPALADEALQAWKAAIEGRPAQVATRAGEELEKLLPKGKYKTESAAHQKRIAASERAAERAIPIPETPGGYTAFEAERMAETAGRAWPGNALAATGSAAGATGIPGVMLDDAKSLADPLYDLRKDVAKEGDVDRRAPFRSDAAPEVAHYQQQRDQAARRRNINMGLAGAETLGGIGSTYGAMKSLPWAASRSAPGLALDLAMIHPLLAPLALAPFAVPAALGATSWAMANGVPDKIEHAEKGHAQAKLIDKLLNNYREQPNPMALGPDTAAY